MIAVIGLQLWELDREVQRMLEAEHRARRLFEQEVRPDPLPRAQTVQRRWWSSWR